jgi:type VI secretion system secreted protein Hcp
MIPTSIIMKIKAQQQGDIKGDLTQTGREGYIKVISVNHEITVPIDPSTGLPTARKQHRPLLVLKELDRSTINLYNSLLTNEILLSVELKFWTQPQTGTEVNFFNTSLTNAKVVSIRQTSQEINLTQYEEVRLTYQKIEWRNLIANTVSQGDWSTNS